LLLLLLLLLLLRMLLLRLDRQIGSEAILILGGTILPGQETVDVVIVNVVVVTARAAESAWDYTSWGATAVGRGVAVHGSDRRSRPFCQLIWVQFGLVITRTTDAADSYAGSTSQFGHSGATFSAHGWHQTRTTVIFDSGADGRLLGAVSRPSGGSTIAKVSVTIAVLDVVGRQVILASFRL
jgi:hypothetical protein